MLDHQSGCIAYWGPSVESLPREATAESDHQSGLPGHDSHMLSQPSLVNREGSKTGEQKVQGESREFIIFLC